MPRARRHATVPPPQMKTTNPCPQCQSRRFLVMPEVFLPGVSSSRAHAVPAFTAPIGAEEARPGSNDLRECAGRIEMWTCAQCGFTERYAVGLESLDLSKMGGHIRYVDAAAPAGPTYR